MQSRAKNIRLIAELVSLELAFDESKHPRDHGKFTFKGKAEASGKNKKKSKGKIKRFFENRRKEYEKEERKEREYRKTSKGKRDKKLRIAGVAAINAGGVAGYGYLIKRAMNDPSTKNMLTQMGLPNFNVKHIHIAGTAAIAGAAAGGLQALQEKRKDNPEFDKKYRKVRNTLLAVGGAKYAHSMYKGHTILKTQRKMAKEIIKTASKHGINAEGLDHPMFGPLIKSKILKQMHMRAKKGEKFERLAKQIRIFHEFENKPVNLQLKIARQLHGHKSFTEHVKHIASKVARKFRPMKVVHLAGQLT